MFLLRQFLFTYVFARRLEKRERPQAQRLLAGLLILAAGILFHAFVYRPGTMIAVQGTQVTVVLSTIAICTLNIFLIAVWVRFFYNVKRTEAFYAVILGYLAEHSAYALEMVGAQYLHLSFGMTVPGQILNWVFLFLYAALIDRIFAERIIKDNHYRTQTRETTAFMLVSAFIVMYLSAIATQYGYAGIHGVYAFVFCIFALAAQTERQNALSEQQKYEIKEQLLISQNAQFESYKENMELVNRKCHDLKHQVAAIKQMNSEESREKALNEIEDAVMIYDSFIRTGCDMLDTILTQKNHICIENGILFTCIVNGELLTEMDPVDLYTIFGNMLDNAIEATVKVPEEKRSISLSVTNKMGAVIISEENPYDSINVSEGQFMTTKKDKINHGYGLRSIEMAVEKYEGSFETRAEDGFFKLTIALPSFS